MVDYLSRFIFKDQPVRGEHTQLTQTWQEILQRRAYPKNVEVLLGELIAAAALLAATVKIEGNLTIQVQATGKVSLMLVQIDHEGRLRALARHKDVEDENGLLALCKAGQLIITLESPNFKEPYQGVIPLLDESIAKALERYFETSEQLPTRIHLAADHKKLAGFFLQRLPGVEDDSMIFEELSILAATLTSEEMQSLSTEDLLHRLYHEYDVEVFPSTPITFNCACSREKTAQMLRHFDKPELESMLEENEGKIGISCEFCGKTYEFDAIDIQVLGDGSVSENFH